MSDADNGQAMSCATPGSKPESKLPEAMKAAQWKPGQSGNPSGRAKMPESLKEAFRKASPRALQIMVSIMDDEEEEPGARIRAAQTILDRAYGKVPQVDEDGRSLGGAILLITSENTEGI